MCRVRCVVLAGAVVSGALVGELGALAGKAV